VTWAYRAEPSDREVLGALVTAVNHDTNVNVRLAAVDALRRFAASPETRRAVVEALPSQTTPLVQVALIDLLVDFKDTECRRGSENAGGESGSKRRSPATSPMGIGETAMKKLLVLTSPAVLMAPAALPQDTQKVTVPFRNPSQPRKLVVDMMLGSVTVRGL
jgi:hypothetical protein